MTVRTRLARFRALDERWFAAAFIVASLALVVVGIFYSLSIAGDNLRFPDERDYIAIATHLLEGVGYSEDGREPSASRPPGYPLALAAMLVPGESIHVVRGLQFAMIAATTALLARLTQPHTVGPAALAATLLVAIGCYPVVLYTAGTLFPQSLIALLIAGVLALSFGPATFVRHGLAGLLCGWSVLASPTTLTVVPLALLVAWRRGGATLVIVVAIGCALLPGAWTARNLVVLGEPIVLSRNLALNLDNAVLEASHADDDVVAAREPDSAFGYGTERLVQLLQEPGIYLGKLAGFFAFRNDLATESEESALRDAVMFASYYALLALVAWRILQVRHHPLAAPETAILLLYVATALFHALVFTRIRYRVPFDCLLLLPAVNALWIASGARTRPRAIGSVAGAGEGPIR